MGGAGMVVMGAELVEQDWELVKRQLPAGWMEAARATGAIKLERGALADPELLLRLLLGRAASDKPHREVVEHVKQTGLVEVSNVALHKREKKCGDWLQWITDAMLGDTMSELPEQTLRLRLIDATCASKPGSKGTDFRLHVCVDLPERRFTQTELTDKRGGESFDRFRAAPGDVLVGDRAYATAKGIGHVMIEGAYCLVRANASSLPLFGSDGCRIDPLALARCLAPGEILEVPAEVRPDGQDAVVGRLCLMALPEREARDAQRRTARQRNRKGRRPGMRALESAKYIVVFTTVPQHMMSTAQVFVVYRLRWQVELAFKTLKTVLHYARLPNRRPDSGRTWLLAKLVCALILERIAAASAARPPERAAA
jgi:hypothetical protein